MTTKIYVVMGETGEYSSRTDWPVVAYPSEAAAQAHVARAEQWLRENGLATDQDFERANRWEETHRPSNPHDPAFRTSYTGARYYIMAADFIEDQQ